MLPTPVPAPRMTLPPHLLNTTQNDTTVDGKLFNPVAGRTGTIERLLADKDKAIWLKSLANEIGRCSIGLHKFHKPHYEISGNNMVFFIKPSQVPAVCKVAYCNFVTNYEFWHILATETHKSLAIFFPSPTLSLERFITVYQQVKRTSTNQALMGDLSLHNNQYWLTFMSPKDSAGGFHAFSKVGTYQSIPPL